MQINTNNIVYLYCQRNTNTLFLNKLNSNIMKITSMKPFTSKTLKTQIKTGMNVTVAEIAFDGEYYYIANRNANYMYSFLRTMVLYGFDRYNETFKRDGEQYKAYRYKTLKGVNSRISKLQKMNEKLK